ncbi:MAG: hypothetical protein U0640_02880 [Phycisphaerales bacterium]
MSKGQEYSSYQKKVINRYYEHRDTIYTTKLGELVGSIALATSDKERDKLWKSAREYLTKSGVDKNEIARVCDARDMKQFAEVVARLAK